MLRCWMPCKGASFRPRSAPSTSRAFPTRFARRVSALALSVINDVITRETFSRQFTLIDLRLIFADDKDYANPIEPSVQGGMKLARAVHRFVSTPSQVVI